MIAYEIQLRYLIRGKIWDKIQSGTKFSKFSPRQNPVWDKIFFCWKKLSGKIFVSDIVSDFQCAKWAVLDKLMLIITKRCMHTAMIFNTNIEKAASHIILTEALLMHLIWSILKWSSRDESGMSHECQASNSQIRYLAQSLIFFHNSQLSTNALQLCNRFTNFLVAAIVFDICGILMDVFVWFLTCFKD